MRVSAWFLVAVFCGCRPSAKVYKTTPVANLQAYRTVALNVRSTAFASQGRAMMLEAKLVENLRRQCSFEQIGRSGQAPADIVLDLNITNTGRGSANIVSIDTLLVLSDGQNGELVGTARIRGESSGSLMGGGSENEAIEVVAKSIADMLAKSGCSGPRLARAEPPPEPEKQPPPPTGQGSGSGSAAPVVDESRRAEAEALNEDGKVKLRSADIAGALQAFQQANAVVPDARYQYNVCLALEASERWDDAIAACHQARAMNPEPRLVAKIDKRIALLQQHK